MGKRKHEESEQTAKQQEPEEADASDEADSDEGSDMPSDSESDEEPSSGSSSSGSEDGSSSGPEVSDDAEDADSEDPDAFDKIDVNFEFFDPKESDFHGLKALLHSYLDGQQYDSSPLIDAIIQQVRRSHHSDCSCTAALNVDCAVDWHVCGACAD